jgi:hypothetical protein
MNRVGMHLRNLLRPRRPREELRPGPSRLPPEPDSPPREPDSPPRELARLTQGQALVLRENLRALLETKKSLREANRRTA